MNKAKGIVPEGTIVRTVATMEEFLGTELWRQVPIGVQPDFEERWRQYSLEQDAIQV